MTRGPYIKIITQRNRWPTPDARAHLAREPPPPGEGSDPPRGGKGRPRPRSREGAEGPGLSGPGREGVRSRAAGSEAGQTSPAGGERTCARGRVRVQALHARLECAHVCGGGGRQRSPQLPVATWEGPGLPALCAPLPGFQARGEGGPGAASKETRDPGAGPSLLPKTHITLRHSVNEIMIHKPG